MAESQVEGNHQDDYKWKQIFLVLFVIATVAVGFMIRRQQTQNLVPVGALAFFIVGLAGMKVSRQRWMHEIASPLLALSLGVYTLDQIYQLRVIEQDKHLVVRQMASRYNATALEAIRILRYEDWLFDGTLAGHSFPFANLHNAKLQYANLHDVDFAFVQLNGADLSGANVQGADFGGADLRDVDLSFTHLELANLKNAMYNDGTNWPDDFDPVKAGLIFAE